ncbi:MAG: 50S ribosomal protein L25 [Anaerolineales bacterium]
MEKVILKATRRHVTGKQVRALRRAGALPAVLYGHHLEPLSISLDAHEAGKVLNRLTASSLVTIDVEGKEYPALVRERQRNPIKGNLIHVDFQAVSLTEKIRTNVGIVITGTAPAVKDFSAILVTTLNELEVEAYPQDLPERIVVDISGLKKVGDGIRVGDLVLSEKVTVLTDADEMIVLATAPREEVLEEVTPEAAAVAEAAEPEVIEKGKKEEEVEE